MISQFTTNSVCSKHHFTPIEVKIYTDIVRASMKNSSSATPLRQDDQSVVSYASLYRKQQQHRMTKADLIHFFSIVLVQQDKQSLCMVQLQSSFYKSNVRLSMQGVYSQRAPCYRRLNTCCKSSLICYGKGLKKRRKVRPFPQQGGGGVGGRRRWEVTLIR